MGWGWVVPHACTTHKQSRTRHLLPSSPSLLPLGEGSEPSALARDLFTSGRMGWGWGVPRVGRLAHDTGHRSLGVHRRQGRP